MKSERDIDAMKKAAKMRVAQILEMHGLAAWKKAGLRKTLADALVMAALRGEVS